MSFSPPPPSKKKKKNLTLVPDEVELGRHLREAYVRTAFVDELPTFDSGSVDAPFSGFVVVIQNDDIRGIGEVDLIAGVAPCPEHQGTQLGVVRVEGDVDLAARLKGPRWLPSHVSSAGQDGTVLVEIGELELHPATKQRRMEHFQTLRKNILLGKDLSPNGDLGETYLRKNIFIPVAVVGCI